MIRVLIITDNVEEWARKIIFPNLPCEAIHITRHLTDITVSLTRYQIISNPSFCTKTLRCDKIIVDKPIDKTIYNQLFSNIVTMPRIIMTRLSDIVGC